MNSDGPIYGRSRYPQQPAKRLCRGCHQPVPSNRQTWCSKECYQKFEPRNVRSAVDERDKRVCQLCHRDISAEEKDWLAGQPDRNNDWLKWCAWRRLKPVVEYDHIVPFCEGGKTILENMRTLCVPCHRNVTKELRSRRAAQDRVAAKSEARHE